MRMIFGLIAILYALGVASGVAGGNQPEGPFYEVQPGDNLYSIAQQFGQTVQALQDANGIADPSMLAIGQQLLLPGYEGVVGIVRTRALQPGENLRTLPLQLAAARSTLLKLNGIVNPAALYLGQQLIYVVPEHIEAERTGRFVLATMGDTGLGLAVRAGRGSYELELLNDWPTPHMLIPGEIVYLPGEQPLGALPAPFEQISISNENPEQGHPVFIKVVLSANATISGSFAEEDDLHFASLDNKHICLFGINAMTEPGLYPIVLRARTVDGDSAILEMRLPVANARYQKQHITLLPEKAQLLEDENARVDEDAFINRTATRVSPEAHWTGHFELPVPADFITTRFGLRRSYNGGAVRRFHGGVDFGALEDTPIQAAASGVVVLAEELSIRGNATMIDHGVGVYTGYWHQSEVMVDVGQWVQSGEIIGSVGDSGLSTGTHLHWEVWVSGTQVDPLEWMRLDIP